MIWDNTGVLHRVEAYPPDSGRLMHRVALVKKRLPEERGAGQELVRSAAPSLRGDLRASRLQSKDGASMASNDYKILLFMKRRPGMTMDDFVDYYENRHVPLALKYASRMSGYTRRYLTPQPTPETGQTDELPYDVITELSFDDETTFAALSNTSPPP